MARKQKKHSKQKKIVEKGRNLRPFLLIAIFLAFGLLLFSSTEYDSYASLYDAEYVGAEKCGECHTFVYDDWLNSPHAKMTRFASAESVVGNFEDGTFFAPDDPIPAATMSQQGDQYIMSIRNPGSADEYTDFEVAYTIGYQYRQTYLTQEADGVLRRLPIQWSEERQEFYPYWNFQENSPPSVDDLWAQMEVNNSAWNLFCARCHTTHLEVNDKDDFHTRADTEWVDNGIACEACHGAGSQHVNYFEHNYVNRVAAFLNSNLRGEPVAYIANAPKLPAGEDLSVCARCHGADIFMSATDAYRQYEPGYSREGRINDLSQHFTAAPLTPGRDAPTVEVWEDGRPKGIGMLFRSMVESACYIESQEIRCYDCHDAHDNKKEAIPDIMHPSEVSNNYCLECHSELEDRIEDHSHHEAGTAGSFCMDCHMPNSIVNLVSMTDRRTRTHDMSSIPQPSLTLLYGEDGSPNACNECHVEESAEWSAEWVQEWWRNP